MLEANIFAWLMLFLWPIFSAIFYRLLSLPTALCATLIGGYLILPGRVSLDFPILPPLDKHTIPALSALTLVALSVRRPRQTWHVQVGWLPKSLGVRFFMILILLGTFGTVMTNRNALYYGETVLPGLRLYDALSIVLGIAMMLIPFVLGRKVMASPEGQDLLLKALVVSAAVYAFLGLYEVRMSPQLNNMVYGFFPHSWNQHVRGDGFRPLVFLSHGLWLGHYLALAVVAAAGLLRMVNTRERSIWALAGVWILGTLFLAKSLGPIMIALFFLPVVLCLPKRGQVLVAATIAAIVLTFPLARTTNLIPLDQIASFAAKIDPDRAASFQYRLDNEAQLLAKVQEKPLLGWGGWGRGRVYDATGRDISTTDGYWIVQLSQGGWVLYIGVFGLLSWGIFALLRRNPNAFLGSSVFLALLMAASLVDLIPNATITPITWLIAGALTGGLEHGAVVKRVAGHEKLETERATGVLARTFQRTVYNRSTQTPLLRRHSPNTKPEESSLTEKPRYRREFPNGNRINDKKS